MRTYVGGLFFTMNACSGRPQSGGPEANASDRPDIREIRIHEEGEFRVIYTARYGETIYAFQKKSRRTKKNH
jgi:phage-related protein